MKKFKKTFFFLFIVIFILAIVGFTIHYIYEIKIKKDYVVPIIDIGEKVEFKKTYNVKRYLAPLDNSGDYKYYIVSQYQVTETAIVKISARYNLEENQNYEFSFEGFKKENKSYSIEEIFNDFGIINIEKTDKTGMAQTQDAI